MSPEDFYSRLPKNKIELIDGQVLIGSSLDVSRMVLTYILRGHGTGCVAKLADKSLLRAAYAEAFGRGDAWQAPQFAKGAPSTPVHRMASELMMNIYALHRYGVWGRDLVIKLGEDAFTPDIFVHANRNDARMRDYYFEGVPDLIVEVMHPATRAFDAGLRLQRYQAAGTPEIWLIDHAAGTLTTYCREEGYAARSRDNSPLTSTALPELTLYPDRLWRVKAAPMRNYHDLVADNADDSPPEKQRRTPAPGDSWGWGSIPFAPEIALEATPVSFAQFISWAPEAKFEWWDKRPQIGGGHDTTLHLTGLLVMTLGLTETLRLLEPGAWEAFCSLE